MAAPGTVTVGSFDLLRQLGTGSVGQVWEARHVRSGTHVAVKIMTGDLALDPWFRDAFRKEAHAIAGLDHPNVVMILEHGEVDGDASKASGRAFRRGSPWIAMELGTRGTLGPLRGRVQWDEAHRALGFLLDALAHSHANNVIHLDLKPANVLLGCERIPGEADGPRISGLRLCDFSVACQLDKPPDFPTDKTIGTPHYMAPEQVRARWRQIGPWTDLYALGAMTWRLITGYHPFRGKDPIKVMKAHLREDPPPFQPRCVVPAGLEDWLRKLMAKSPSQRYLCAADARDALRELSGGLPTASVGGPLEISPDAPTDVFAPTTNANPVLDGVPTESQEPAPRAPSAPIETDWRQLRPPPPATPLVDAGLSLLGLRAVPFIGREEERDEIWNALRRVQRNDQPEAILVSGPAGCGKSRLLEWIAVRAHELGAAEVLRVHHGAGGGIMASLLRWLGVDDLDEGPALKQLTWRLGLYGPVAADLPHALLGWMRPSLGSMTPSSPLSGLLGQAGGVRPLILVLDDVQLGAASLAMLQNLLAEGLRVPLLVLMAAQDEALAERDEERALLDALAPRTLNLPRLTDVEQEQLVRGILRLESQVMSSLVEQSAGNPAYVVEVVDAQVSRGALVPGPRGFRLAGGSLEPSDELLQPVRERLERVVGPASPSLERAAALGMQVQLEEWAASMGMPADPDLVARLEEARLVRPLEGGFEFASSLVRAALVSTARDNQRWAKHNQACAVALSRLSETPGRSERLGRHLLEAGDYEPAFDRLMIASRHRRSQGQLREARRACESAGQALAMSAAPAEDVRWGSQQLEAVEVERQLGRVEAALDAARQLHRAAEHFSWTKVEAAAQAVVGWGCLRTGRRDEAIDALRQARERCRTVGASEHAIMATLGMAELMFGWGLREKARELVREAITLAETEGLEAQRITAELHLAEWEWRRGEMDKAELAVHRALALGADAEDLDLRSRVHRDMARLLIAKGDFDTSYEHAEQSYALSLRTGNLLAIQADRVLLGEVARMKGHLDVAETHFRGALAITTTSGLPDLVPRLNLAQVLLARGHAEEATGLAERCLREAAGEPEGVVHVVCQACLAHAASLQKRWRDFDRYLDETARAVERQELIERDLAERTEQGGRAAWAAGERRRAKRAWRVALRQWRGLGATAKAGAVEQLLSQPGGDEEAEVVDWGG